MPKKVLIPLPRFDFDPTEAAVPWKILTLEGFQVFFATPDGVAATCDNKMLTGKSLGVLAPLLKADNNVVEIYQQMITSDSFREPLSWSEIQYADYAGLLLPGGHDKGMREFLESEILQKLVADFFKSDKPVAAICHGTVLVARSKNDGKSVLYGKKTTALLRSQELSAWLLTCLWLKDYYRTYKETVEDEVKRNLLKAEDFISGPLPLFRDSPSNLKAGFTVFDGNYLSARWPGDAHKFGLDFVQLLKEHHPKLSKV